MKACSEVLIWPEHGFTTQQGIVIPQWGLVGGGLGPPMPAIAASNPVPHFPLDLSASNDWWFMVDDDHAGLTEYHLQASIVFPDLHNVTALQLKTQLEILFASPAADLTLDITQLPTALYLKTIAAGSTKHFTVAPASSGPDLNSKLSFTSLHLYSGNDGMPTPPTYIDVNQYTHLKFLWAKDANGSELDQLSELRGYYTAFSMIDTDPIFTQAKQYSFSMPGVTADNQLKDYMQICDGWCFNCIQVMKLPGNCKQMRLAQMPDSEGAKFNPTYLRLYGWRTANNGGDTLGRG